MQRSEFLRLIRNRRNAATGAVLSLDPYTGPWTDAETIHLLRRCTFGFSPDQVKAFTSAGMDNAVNALLNIPASQPAPPLNVYSTALKPDPDTAYGQTWVNAPFNAALPPEYYQARTDTLKAWWTGLMLQDNLHIREKMTLFWHNHFAVEADTVQIAQATYWYLDTLRRNCLGNFKSMTRAISIDPAMLRYLNGVLNSKAQPDENYARELQELFTVGKGPGSKYTEEDVKQAARVLTGFRINPFTSPISMFFDSTQHDTGDKQFSAFYKNTVIKGKSGLSGAAELDDLLNMIFATSEVALFICRKIYQFFVYYDLTPAVETNVIAPMAEIFRNNNYEIRPVMDALLRSAHFYDVRSRGCIIKSPLDFAAGLSRQFKVAYPAPAPDPLPLYRQWGLITYYAAAAGLNVLDPPLVAGFPAWYQPPMFHRVWINSDTMASRLLLINAITGSGANVNGTILKLDPVPFTQSLPDAADPNALITDAVKFMYGLTVSKTTRDYYKTFLLQGLTDDYWTTLWGTFLVNPGDPTLRNTVTTRLSAMYREMMLQAEYHLC